MTKSAKLVAFGAVVVLFLLICAIGGIYWLMSPVSYCNEGRKASVPSPDGKYIAVIYQRSCGVGVESYAHVNLFEASEKVHPRLISGRTTQGTVFTADWYPQHLKAQWMGTRTLLIDCSDCTRDPNSPQVAREQRSRWRDVSILYKLKDGSR